MGSPTRGPALLTAHASACSQKHKMSEWKQGLFGCFGNCGVCCFGYCCSCCQVYKNAESLGKSGILCCLLSMVLPCAPTLLLRQEARDRWNIEGEVGSDVAAAFCCTPCVNCQTAVEIEERGASS